MQPIGRWAVQEYLTADGSSPFSSWFAKLDAVAAAKVTVALTRLEMGNTSSLKGIGGGLVECRIDHGPGYRMYFASIGERWLLLLAGGTKRRQQHDIDAARARWMDYRQRRTDAR